MGKQKRHFYIYPAVGISRVGNSETDFLISPDVINQKIEASQLYKDIKGKVKRQAARFRVYEFNHKGEVIEEVTSSKNVKIDWRVHLANRKSINYQFKNAMDLGRLSIDCPLRNGDIVDLEERKEKLLLDSGQRSIEGILKNQDNADCSKGENYVFDSAKFYEGTSFQQDVYLGELRTDEKGRLLVLGGRGKSASYDGSQAITFANNEGWHDDVSDGTVRATVTIGGESFEVNPAMVAVTPPNFAPGIEGTVTLLDVVENLFEDEKLIEPIEEVLFYRDIYPIFKSLVDNQAVNEGFYFLFGENAPGNFTEEQLLSKLSDNRKRHQKLRKYLFNQFRPSVSVSKERRAKALIDLTEDRSFKNKGLTLQVGGIAIKAISESQEAIQADQLPPFYGDAYGDYGTNPLANLSLTDRQYKALEKWSEGDFENEGNDYLVNGVEDLPLQDQPAALTKGHLSYCLGGPFHPGIELTWFMRRISMWNTKDSIDSMRLNILGEGVEPQDFFGPILTPDVALEEMFNASGPGTLTRFMGVPWQTDEASCRSGQDYDPGFYLPLATFWSARVPNQVLSERSFERLSNKDLPFLQRIKHLDYRQDWLRFFNSTKYEVQINGMVRDWDKIGIVKERVLETPIKHGKFELESLWVESEVNKKFTVNDSSFRQLLHMENLANVGGKIKALSSKETDYAEDLRRLEQEDCDFAESPEESRPTFTRQELFGAK